MKKKIPILPKADLDELKAAVDALDRRSVAGKVEMSYDLLTKKLCGFSAITDKEFTRLKRVLNPIKLSPFKRSSLYEHR